MLYMHVSIPHRAADDEEPSLTASIYERRRRAAAVDPHSPLKRSLCRTDDSRADAKERAMSCAKVGS